MESLARRSGVAVAILAIVALGRADAGTISYTVPLNSKTQPGLVPLFNPGLGTLNEVDFSASGTLTTFVSFTSLGLSGGYREVISQYLIFFPPEGQMRFDVTTFHQFSLNPNSSGLNVSDNYTYSTVIPASAAFIGNREFNVQVGGQLDMISTNPPDGPIEMGNTFVFGSAVVTYVYVVPGPSSVVMGGTAALVGLGHWWLRRRRAIA